MEELEIGEKEAGEVIGKEIDQYLLVVQKEFEDVKVKLSLETVLGDSDLYAYECPEYSKYGCLITDSMIETKTKIQGLTWSDNLGKAKDEIELVCQNKFNLSKNKNEYCVWIIGVQAKDKQDKSTNKYELIAWKGNYHRILGEFVRSWQHIQENETQYYIFPLWERAGVDEVDFEYNVINGEIMVIVSRDWLTDFPTINDAFENNKSLDIGMANQFESSGIIQMKEDKLSEVYYIGINGGQAGAVYSLGVAVKRQGTKSRRLLLNGVRQLVEFKSEEEMEFLLENSQKLDEFILIELEFLQEQPSYNISLRNGYENKSFTLPNSRIIYTNQHVQPEVFNNGTGSWLATIQILSKNMTGQYWISFITEKSLMELTPGDIQIFEIYSQMQRFFQFTCNENTTEITFAAREKEKEVLIGSHEITLYMNAQQKNQAFQGFPDSKKFNKTVKSKENTARLTLSSEELQELCQKNLNNCIIYLTVESSQDSTIGIIAVQEEMPIFLQDGKEIFTKIDGVEKTKADFVAFMKNDQIEVTATSIEKDFQIALLVNVMNPTELFDKTDSISFEKFKFPSKKTMDSTCENCVFESSGFFGAERIVIQKKQLANQFNCTQTSFGCALLIRVVSYNQSKYQQKDNILVLATSNLIQPLINGKKITSYVEKGEYKYFSIEVNKTDCMLFIGVMPLSSGSNPDVFVCHSSLSEQQKHPTKDYHDFFSNSIMGEQLMLHPTKLGTYTIGVYGQEQGPFSILASFGDSPINEMHQGFFQDFNLDDGEEIYLFYQNNDIKDQKLLFSVQQGILFYFITTVKDIANIAQSLPQSNQPSSYKWSNLNHSNIDLFIIGTKDPNFCSNCYYVILIKSLSVSQFSFVATSNNAEQNKLLLPNCRTVHDKVNYLENNYYVMLASKGVTLNFNFGLNSGQIKVSVKHSNSDTWSVFNSQSASSGFTQFTFNYQPTENSSGLSRLQNLGVLVDFTVQSIGSESDYTVSVCEEGTQIPQLLNGIAIPAVIKAKEILKYNFMIKDNEKIVELYFEWKTEEFPSFDFSFYHNKSTETEGQLMDSSFIQEQKILEKALILKVVGHPGLYQMNIKNKLSTKFKFTIRLTTSLEKNIRLPIGYQGYGQLKKGTEEIFEILNTKNSGAILIELSQCFGEVDAWIGNDYLKVRNRKEIDGQVVQLRMNENNNQLAEIFSSKQSPLYLLVKGRLANEFGVMTDEMYKKYLGEDFPDQLIYFQVHTASLENSSNFIYQQLVSKVTNPYDWVSHGNNGNILVNINDENLEFSTNKITIETEKYNDGIQQITYIISIAEDDNVLKDIMRCRISAAKWMHTKYFATKHYTLEKHINENKIKFSEPVENIMKELSIQFKDQLLFANIKAEITFEKKNKKDNYNLNVYYNQAVFTINNLSEGKSESKGMSFGWIFLIIIFCSVIFGVLYLYYRYKKLQGIQEYKIKDSRNLSKTNPKFDEQELQSSANYIQMKE